MWYVFKFNSYYKKHKNSSVLNIKKSRVTSGIGNSLVGIVYSVIQEKAITDGFQIFVESSFKQFFILAL